MSTLPLGANSVLRNELSNLIRPFRQRLVARAWLKMGKPLPPPHMVKQLVVKQYAKRCSLKVLVETGTYYGAMIDATRGTFDRIISIELDDQLYELAREKYASYDHITILHGDSSEVLGEVLGTITEPCLFWLDGHYSGPGTARGESETPVVRELSQIVQHDVSGHVILIDDAREFSDESGEARKRGYPTMGELKKMVEGAGMNWVIEVRDDIIRLTPKCG